VDVQEIRKVESYIRRLFGNTKLRVVPRQKKKDSADVLLGEEAIGVLSVDDEDGERSYNFEMPIAAADVQDIRKAEDYIRLKLDNTRLRVVPRPTKKDSADVLLGEEFIGVLFIVEEKGKRSYIFEMAILDLDLEEA
jgi:predicted RecB family endonuclease